MSNGGLIKSLKSTLSDASGLAMRLLPEEYHQFTTWREKVAKPINQWKVFISYAQEDGNLADLIQLQIQKKGYHGWIDTEQLQGGEDWRQEVDEQIRESAAVLLVVSPHSQASHYVTYEWAFALGCGVPVIPIQFELTELHPRLKTLHVLNFSDRATRPWDRLMETLLEKGRKEHLDLSRAHKVVSDPVIDFREGEHGPQNQGK